LAESLKADYGFRPMAASLQDENTFWFYLVLSDGEQTIQIPLPEDLSSEGVKRGLDAALKRFSSGFLKTVALSTPKAQPSVPMLGMQSAGLRYTLLKEHLRQNALVAETDLTSGYVADETDLLMVIAPENLDDRQLFAIDQFVMRGGSLVLASSAFQLTTQGDLAIAKYNSGLQDWLRHHGLVIEPQLVLDRQNTPFPIPIQRDVGGFMVQELRMIDYPYFIDLRESGIDQETGLLAGISQLTLNWASPISLDVQKSSHLQVNTLLHSSKEAWLSEDKNMQPDFTRYGTLGFPVDETNQREQVLAIAMTGTFESYFKGKASPLLGLASGQIADDTLRLNRVIDKSPKTARIILFASNSFLSDDVINLASSASGNLYTNGLQAMINAVDWSLEDRGLLAIRGRDHFSRTLGPLDKAQQQFWEYVNYGVGLLGLALIYLILRLLRLRANSRYRRLLERGA